MSAVYSSDTIEMLEQRAELLGLDSIRMTTKSGSGHPTSCLSCAQIISVLFFHTMQYDPLDPHATSNDRLILSKGHAAPILYAVFRQRGIVSEKDMLHFRTYDSVLEGHPTPRWPYHEAATGSLGQGLAVGVGIARAHKQQKRNAMTYVVLGDSECAEGSVWEAASLASYYKLNNLIAVLDLNRLGQTGPTAFDHDVAVFQNRFEAFGWQVITVDGHDVAALINAFDQAKQAHDKPVIVIAKTFKGHGFAAVENKEDMHGKPFKKGMYDDLRIEEKAKELEFLVMPAQKPNPSTIKHDVDAACDTTSEEYKQSTTTEKESTRKAAGLALRALGKKYEAVVALDAEVGNSTFFNFFFEQFPERSTQCFVAEQAMVSLASGFALQNLIPFAATFSAFFTRAADQIRMAGIGKTPLRLVGTHAGISIGEDGPSQMGLEDLGLFRAVPDSIVLYPSDAHATFSCMGLMAAYDNGISYLRATRADTPHLYKKNETFKIGGSHVLVDNDNAQCLIIAAGITVHEALKAEKKLQEKGIAVSIIDAYSIKPLDAQTVRSMAEKVGKKVVIVEDHYKEGGLGEAVMAATFDLACQVEHLCVKTYARSGSPEELMERMEIDAQAIVAQAIRLCC